MAEAGKHLLTEKPACASTEMRPSRMPCETAGIVYLEGFHYPYHPLFLRVREILASGGIGEVRHVEAPLWMPAPPDDDPRWSLALAGGARWTSAATRSRACDSSAITSAASRTLVSAAAVERAGRPGVDERLASRSPIRRAPPGQAAPTWTYAGRNFTLPSPVRRARSSARCSRCPSEDDTLYLAIAAGHDDVVEHLGRRTSYTYQLEAFAAAVRTGAPVVTDIDFSVANMAMIDAAYVMAGMQPRQPGAGALSSVAR